MPDEKLVGQAEARFRRKELQVEDGRKAMAEYVAEREGVQAKIARLRALRLARDAAAAAAPKLAPARKPAAKAAAKAAPARKPAAAKRKKSA
jgi:hypothetical protein